jgi:hypothetical protein
MIVSRHHVVAALTTILSLGSLGLLAATFSELSPRSPLTGKPSPPAPALRLTGAIEQGDSEKLREILADLQRRAPRVAGKPLVTLEMSSQGGDLIEGMKLGYLLREFDVATLVRAGDSCLSSCALAFLGGTASHLPTDMTTARTLEIGSTLGFHNFALNPNSPAANDAASPREGIARGFNQAKGGASLLVHYAASLGVDPTFIARMLGRPPEVWEYADAAGEFMDLKICPSGRAATTPSGQRRAMNICANAIGAGNEPASPSVFMLRPAEAKRQLLTSIQRNLSAYGVRGPVATQLGQVLASRDDRQVDAAYADLQSAGLPLPEIAGQTFQIDGFGAGTFALQCIVSFPADDPDRFDVVINGPTGLTRPTNRPPAACGRLFAFDRSDVVNPERR